MAEQIKFELDSDETFDILKDIGEAENELGKERNNECPVNRVDAQ